MKQEKKFQLLGKRQLKVYGKYISRPYHRHVVYPEIRLCGKWLQKIGFNCGQNVTVRHKKNKIIITVGNETESDE